MSDKGYLSLPLVEQSLRRALDALDLTLWSKSGAHVFNSETALRDLATSLQSRLVVDLLPLLPPDRDEGLRAADAALLGEGFEVVLAIRVASSEEVAALRQARRAASLTEADEARGLDVLFRDIRSMIEFTLDTSNYPDDHPIPAARRHLLSWFDARLAAHNADDREVPDAG